MTFKLLLRNVFLFWMLARNISTLIGEHVKLAYGGEDEAFLWKVVTPIYNTIAEVIVLMLFTYFCVHAISFFLFDGESKGLHLFMLFIGSSKEQGKIKAFQVEKI